MHKNTTITLSIPIGVISIITFLVFMILKLCEVVSWSWLIVCIPLMVLGGWIVLWFIIYLIVFIIALIIT